ncbi:MAG TPA: hypothetical protein VK689_23830, partial [Armatimonadota bacterium]|nr:hypothetical protein [Armatimonadota bacterium]
MDPHQVSLPTVTSRRTALTAAVLTAVVLAPLGGCARKANPESGNLSKRLQRKLNRRKDDTPPLSIVMSGNSLQVEDAKGLRVLDAKVEKMDGKVTTGKGIDGPVRFKVAKCRLYKDGKPQLNLDAPEAVWDGKQLIAEKAVHAVTPEGDRVMDATRSIWTAANGHLELDNGK